MISTPDMLAAGATTREIEAVRKDCVRLRTGAYVPRGLDPMGEYRARCEAVLYALKSAAMLTGPSAAAVLELPIPGPPPARVFVRGVMRGRYGSDVHVINGGADAFGVQGLRLAEPSVVAADCARHMCARDAMIAADALTHAGLCTVEELRDNAGLSRRTRGAARVRWQSEQVDPLAESPGETWTRIILRQLGYDSSSQVVVKQGEFSARLDFLLTGSRTVVEFDGSVKYREPETAEKVVMTEKERQAFLETLGYRVLRAIWKQLFNPQMLDRRIRHTGVRPTLKPLQIPPGWILAPR